MTFWSWDPSLAVGIDPIDRQHRRIIDYINELEVAKEYNDRETVAEVLLGLVDYTQTHFVFEENLMRKMAYPLWDAHRKTHEAFVLQIKKLVREHEAGKDVSRKLSSDLQVWLTNHIKKDDKHFGRYLAKSKKASLKNMWRRLFG